MTDAEKLDNSVNLGEAGEYNIFVFGDHTQDNTESEGRVAVGGNAVYDDYHVGSFYVYSKSLPKPGERNDLIVKGEMDIRGGVNFSGNSIIGCTCRVKKYTMHNRNSYRSQPYKGDPVNFKAAEQYLKHASGYWASLPVNGAAGVGEDTLFLTGEDPDLNVFSVEGPRIGENGLLLSDLKRIVINAPLASTVLINVNGLKVGFGRCAVYRNGGGAWFPPGKPADKTHSSRILWNFYEALYWYNMATVIRGSVLAPFAAMDTLKGCVDGNIIGTSLRGGMAGRSSPFNGSLPRFGADKPDIPEAAKGPVSRQRAVDDFLKASQLAERNLNRILNVVKNDGSSVFSFKKSPDPAIQSYLEYMSKSLQNHTNIFSGMNNAISESINGFE